MLCCNVSHHTYYTHLYCWPYNVVACKFQINDHLMDHPLEDLLLMNTTDDYTGNTSHFG